MNLSRPNLELITGFFPNVSIDEITDVLGSYRKMPTEKGMDYTEGVICKGASGDCVYITINYKEAKDEYHLSSGKRDLVWWNLVGSRYNGKIDITGLCISRESIEVQPFTKWDVSIDEDQENPMNSKLVIKKDCKSVDILTDINKGRRYIKIDDKIFNRVFALEDILRMNLSLCPGVESASNFVVYILGYDHDEHLLDFYLIYNTADAYFNNTGSCNITRCFLNTKDASLYSQEHRSYNCEDIMIEDDLPFSPYLIHKGRSLVKVIEWKNYEHPSYTYEKINI